MGGNRELIDGEKMGMGLKFQMGMGMGMGWEWNEVTEMGGNWDEKSIPAHLYLVVDRAIG